MKRKFEFRRCSFLSGKHGIEKRARAADLIGEGCGEKALARELAISTSIARKWVASYRAVGREVFLGMGSKHRAYDFETKLAAVLDFLEGGLSKPEAMARHGVASPTALDRWVRDYRRGGPEALRPKPKGRPKASPGAPAMGREQELEAENRRLRAENAYLKKLRSLEAAKRAPGRSAR